VIGQGIQSEDHLFHITGINIVELAG